MPLRLSTLMSPRYVLRLDDICETMAWDSVASVVEFALSNALTPLLGVIPDNRDPMLQKFPRRDDAWDRIREWSDGGAQVAMHGYQHTRLTDARGLCAPVRNFSEFAGTPLAQQCQRIRLGHELLMARGLRPCAFMPPAHTLDLNTIEALKCETDIRIVTDGMGLSPYPVRGVTFVPAMGTRVLIPAGIRTLVVHANAMSAEQVERLLAWIDQRRTRFVSITEAARRSPRGITQVANRTVGRAAYSALRTRALARGRRKRRHPRE